MSDLWSHRYLFCSLTSRSVQLQCSQAEDIVTLVTLFLALDISKFVAQVRSVRSESGWGGS